MTGTASLLVVTTSNAFDVYRVSREPYIGLPDRAHAPISPFPGVNGGQGAFVRISNDGFETTAAHLDLDRTLQALPDSALLPGVSRAGLAERFVSLRDFRTVTEVARWEVRRGQIIGLSGDSGYSEAPHVHYTVKRAAGANLLCPTSEPGFADAGWLIK
jgi:hypothetical protein